MANLQTIRIDFFNANYTHPDQVTRQTLRCLNSNWVSQVFKAFYSVFISFDSVIKDKTIIAPFISDPSYTQVDIHGNVFTFQRYLRGGLMVYVHPELGPVMVDNSGINQGAWSDTKQLYTVIQHGKAAGV